MRANCVAAPEIISLAGAGSLVRTHETVAVLEVSVPMPPDLPGVRVPVAAGSNPAEHTGHFAAEVCDRPRIAVFAVTAASLINVIPAVAILKDSATSARPQMRHLSGVLQRHVGGVLTLRSPTSAEGDRGMHVFLMSFRNAGRWRRGTRGGRFLILANDELSGGVGSH